MKRIAILALACAACTSGDSSGTAAVSAAATPAPPAEYALGSAVDSAQLRTIDIDVDPSGATLPAVKMPAAGRFVVDDRKGRVVR